MGKSPRKRKIGRDYRNMRRYILNCWRREQACGGELAMQMTPQDFDVNGELEWNKPN
jgi:hypothetical protein